ncbi:MAG: flagellar biosynthesis protein FlhA [Nitrospira sp.]|nr:MAG: flagellar biosynthesis protein FlhA [Nitrospira sp.]
MAAGETTMFDVKVLRQPDVLMSAGVVGILMIMLLPMPRFVLDLLISLNITLAILVLLVGMQIRKPLEFSVFPSVLLVITLFRLSLNIAATRLILLHGNEGTAAAGDVIRAFGNFVVGGNYTVGLVVFTILIIINFVVITKGAGRVAEVAARFTLDAMPGKQMSIDADLNAGLINEAEARKRRLTIAQEADFYGAMDGASKFVRGDAIASIIIILVNILGGLTIGALQQGMSVANALQTYTLLTVGEGLVTQVPALIISTAAGMVVTRAASDGDLGGEIAKQLFVSPKALGTASAILIGLGLVPGLPHVAFLILGSLVGWLAYEQAKHQQAEPAAPGAAEALAAKPVEAQPHVAPLDLMEVQVGYGLINLVDGEQGGTLLDRIKALRKTTAQSMGFLIPPIHIRDNLQLRPNEYALLLKGVELVRSEVLPGHVLAIDPGTAQKHVVQGIPTKEPAFGLPALWVPEGNREQAQMAGYTVVDASSAITTHLSEVIKRHAHELLGRQEVQSLVDELAKTHPKVVEELIPNLLPLGAVVRILANLLRERVAVRDLRTILEAVADHAGVTKDPEILTEAARQALARSITRQHMNPDGLVPVIALDPRLDRKLAELSASGNQSGEWALEPAMSQKLMGALKQAGERMVGKGQQPVILCSPGVRRHLRRLIDRIMPTVPVLSYAEIDGMAKVKAVETVRAMEEAA